MSTTGWLLLGLAAAALLYAAFVGALVLAGRKRTARALARALPDCLVLLKRLVRDPRTPKRSKALLAFSVAYLALPFDFVPDFIPVAGQLDDALVVLLALRSVIRGSGPALVVEHWPGPAPFLKVVLRLAGIGRRASSA